MNDSIKKKHCITCENRSGCTLTGVTDVDVFTDEEIRCKTDYGNLSIKGSSLHIKSLDLATGDMCITGEVVAFVYSNNSSAKGFFRKAFQ